MKVGDGLFDPGALMETESAGDRSSDMDFAFAFNDPNFSDRVLRLEIVGGTPESNMDDEGCLSISEWAMSQKRRREEIKREKELAIHLEYPAFTNHPDFNDRVVLENQDEEAVAMMDESPAGGEDDLLKYSSWSMDCSMATRVKELHISSAVLARRSPFFYKLFSNGMKESGQRDATLRINASGSIFIPYHAFKKMSNYGHSSDIGLKINYRDVLHTGLLNVTASEASNYLSLFPEEDAVMALLNYMYSEKIATTSPPALLDILMAADKFEVASCMRYCSSVLRNLPMTPETALLFLEPPSTILMADAVQPLTDAAKQFLAKRFKDLSKHQEEIMNLPLAGMEAILSSDDLQVASEDAVFDFVLKWARSQYPNIEERREVMGSRLGSLIRFPNMSSRKLKKVLTCNDMDLDLTSKVVLDALFFKAETPHRQRLLASEESSNKRFMERAYKYRPVKVVKFDVPYQQCVVYLDLKHEECDLLFPSGRIYSQAFHLSGHGFFLSAHCNMDQQSSFHCFGLFLGMQEKGLVGVAVDYEFAARSKPTCDFGSKYRGNYTFNGGKAVGYRNLFGIPWRSFMAEDSPYFINGTLHIRAELTVRQLVLQ